MTINRSRPAITAAGLRKSFGDKLVLDGIDLEVPEGTVFSLLGPNGAGKTTTVHILSTLIRADADAVRAAIGVTGQLTAVDNLLTGEENLLVMADLRHLGQRPAHHLPGRAHHRPGPTQPPHHVAGERPGRLGVAAEAGQGQRAGPGQRQVGRRPLRPQRGHRVVRPGVGAVRGAVPQGEAGLGLGQGRVIAGLGVPGCRGRAEQDGRGVDLVVGQRQAVAGGGAGDDVGAQLGRVRETITCSALAGCSGCSSGQSPSTSRAVLPPLRRSPASRASSPRGRGPVTSRPR
jgi:energy-coupling factor transporter ATP-binding protein EcfA2